MRNSDEQEVRGPMIFDRDIVPCCAYCAHGSCVGFEEVVCKKRGLVPVDGNCRRFVYDPFQRVPDRPPRPAVMDDALSSAPDLNCEIS